MQAGAPSAQGVLNVTQLSLNGDSDEVSKIYLGKSFAIGSDAAGSFYINYKDTTSLSVSKSGDVQIFGKIKAKGVSLSGDLSFMNVNQWLLAAIEDFNEVRSREPFLNSPVMTCGSRVQMGGATPQPAHAETRTRSCWEDSISLLVVKSRRRSACQGTHLFAFTQTITSLTHGREKRRLQKSITS